MRLAAVDGFYLDAPDTPANRLAFGGQVAKDGTPRAYPQVRVLTLSEVGTHAVLDALVGGLVDGELELAVPLAVSARDMLVIINRGLLCLQLAARTIKTTPGIRTFTTGGAV